MNVTAALIHGKLSKGKSGLMSKINKRTNMDVEVHPACAGLINSVDIGTQKACRHLEYLEVFVGIVLRAGKNNKLGVC